MSNYTTVKFKVLSDNCSAEDHLEDRTHERIADKLYEIIFAESSEGMTVGLEGEWGAGKSTVIRLLQEKLRAESQDKTFVFYIDAWEHEGDHLRRVFLEMLIARLKKWRSWSEDVIKKLEDIADRITSKKVSKTVEHRSQMTKFGRVLALSTMLVPLGVALVSACVDQVMFKWTCKGSLVFWVGLLFSIAPVIVYMVKKLLNLFDSKKINGDSKKGFSLFETEEKVDITFETSREEERSSVEFERYCGEILQLLASEIDTIIMVIDNLDRINPEDTLRIWSTLQAFVQNKNPISYKTNKLCKWIIVPYAQEGLEKVWQNGSGGQENSNESKNRPLSFMDKSFQLRLHVPKMVISGWRSFAGKCLKDAAGELDHDDVAKILNVLSWTRKNLTDAPSPRQIKIYINQVGLACSLYGECVPLEAICFYVVKKYLDGLSDNQLEDELRGGEISATSLPQYEHCHELASEVAAILYGVGEDKAMQILLEPVISDCLNNSRSEEIRVIEKMHGIVFYDVLDYVLKQTEKSFIPMYVASIQRAFPVLKERAYSSALNALQLNEDVVFEQMHKIIHEDAIAIIELANIDTNKDLVKKIANAYALELPERFMTDGQEAVIKDVDSPSHLVKHFVDISLVVNEKIAIPYKCFKDAKVDFEKFSEEELKQLSGFICDVDAVCKDIASVVKESNDIPEWVAILLSSVITMGIKHCALIINAIKEHFDDGCVNDAIAWRMLLAWERVSRQVRPIEKMKELIQTDVVWNASDFPNDIAAFLIAKYCGGVNDEELLPDGVRYNKVGEFTGYWEDINMDRGKNIYDYITLSNEFDWLARESLKTDRALVGSVVEVALDNNNSNLFEVESPFNFFAKLLSLVDEPHRKSLVENFISNKGRLIKLAESPDEKLIDYSNASQKLLISIKEREVFAKIVCKMKSEFNALTQEEWTEAFSASNDLVELVALLVENGECLGLANPYCEALKGFVCERIKNDIGCDFSSEILEGLYKAMKPALQKVFATGVGDVLKETKFKIATDDIKAFVLNVPDYEEWLEENRVWVKNIAAELSVDPFDNFITIMERCGVSLSNKAEIKDVIEHTVLEMLKHSDQKLKKIGERAAVFFGIDPIAAVSDVDEQADNADK